MELRWEKNVRKFWQGKGHVTCHVTFAVSQKYPFYYYTVYSKSRVAHVFKLEKLNLVPKDAPRVGAFRKNKSTLIGVMVLELGIVD